MDLRVIMKIKAKRNGQGTLRAFLNEIKSITVEDDWYMSSEDVLKHFGISFEDYYRYVYEKKEFEFDGFSKGNIDLLIELLKDCGINNVTQSFSSAGYYFSDDQLMEFQEYFYSLTLSRLQNHIIDRELLELSLSGCSNAQDGITFYCDSIVDMKELSEFAIRIYLERNGFENNPFSRELLRSYFKVQFARGIIKRDHILSDLKENLYKKAVIWNFINPEMQIPNCEISEEMRISLVTLDFAGNRLPDEKSLKVRYRELVKKYHPDINPDGLDMTRKINEAYNTLLKNYLTERAM